MVLLLKQSRESCRNWLKEFSLKAEEVIEENLAFNANNVALRYYAASANFKKDPEKSAEHLAKINDINYKNTRWTLTAAKVLYQHSLRNQNENYLENLLKAKGYLNKLLTSKQTYFRSRNLNGYEQDKEVLEAGKIIALIDRAMLNAEKNERISKNPSNSNDGVVIEQAGEDKGKLMELAKVLQNNKRIDLAEKIYDKLLSLFPDDREVFADYVEFLKKNNPDKAVLVLEEVVKNEKYLETLTESEVKFSLGKLYFDKAESGSNPEEVSSHYKKSKVFFSDYLSLVAEETPISSKTKNQIIISEKSISHIDLVLSKK